MPQGSGTGGERRISYEDCVECCDTDLDGGWGRFGGHGRGGERRRRASAAWRVPTQPWPSPHVTASRPHQSLSRHILRQALTVVHNMDIHSEISQNSGIHTVDMHTSGEVSHPHSEPVKYPTSRVANAHSGLRLSRTARSNSAAKTGLCKGRSRSLTNQVDSILSSIHSRLIRSSTIG